MRKILDVSITISGLCLVELNGTRPGLGRADELVVSMPGADHRHEARLSFSRDVLDLRDTVFERFRKQKRQLHRFFGPSGTDLYSLELGEGQGGFEVEWAPDPPEWISMRWAPKSVEGAPVPSIPLSESLMDWLILSTEVGLDASKSESLPTRVTLPFGYLKAKNLILDKDRRLYALWSFGDSNKKKAIADDMELTFQCRGLRFVWKDAHCACNDFSIPFKPREGHRLDLCLANDDALVPPLEGLLKPLNPHQDLLLIAQALGGQDLTLPKAESAPSSFGGPCTQILHLNMVEQDG